MLLPRFATLVAVLFAPIGLALHADTPLLPPSAPLVDRADFVPTGGTALVSFERENIGQWKGEDIWRIGTTEAARDPWLVQLYAKLKSPAKKDDRGLLLVHARAVSTSHESDQAQFRFVVAERANPFPRIALAGFSLDREWREIAVPFVFGRDHAPGKVEISLDFGYGRQVVEVAGLRVLSFGPTVPLESLPRTRISYAGHEPDAAWRRDALARIETLRKGGLALLVTDAAGRPVADADIRATLVSHAFQFGTAVNVETFTANSPDTAIYRRHIAELFNAASLENGLKWGNWIGEGKSADYRARTLQTLEWLKARDLALRGHVMVWPGKRFLPRSVLSLIGTAEQSKIPEIVRAHIRDIAVGTKNYIAEWDVLNEPVNNHDLMDLFGREIMVDWFKTAEAALPGVPLFLNDWGNHDQRQSAAHLRDFEEVARYLLSQGAPLHGFGLQCHIGGVLSAPEDILATLDRYQKNFGLPIRVTEFDVNTDDEEIQADYTRDFMIAMFSHPSVIGVQHWGFWAGRHWEPKAALYRKDWTEKLNGTAYRKLVKETWHTDEAGRTDADGRWGARGFLGRYAVTVTVGGKTHEAVVEHRAGEVDEAGDGEGRGVVTVVLPATF